ncbi:MAG TPA: hypothetical protein VJT74_04285 [Pyrinomonadaceae bacterium]|nr:hypothetical protein [Pyrinomonadaceae bacterium]
MKSSLVSLLKKSVARPAVAGDCAEEFLRLFRKHKQAVYRNLDAFGMNFAQLAFPLLYSRCREGFHAEERPEFLLVTNHKRHFVLPLTSDRQAFLGAVVRLVSKGGRVTDFLEVPHMPNRPSRYPEYVCETEFLAHLPGRRVKAYRYDVRKLEAMGVRVEEGLAEADELFELNRQWYAEFEQRKGFRAERFAEAEAVVSLAAACRDDRDLVRVFRALAPVCETASVPARRTLKLCGFLVTCRLSESYWAAVLSRSLFEYSGLGHYMWQRAAQAYLREGVPLENDNSAGFDPALSAYKERFSSQLISPYHLRARRLARFL